MKSCSGQSRKTEIEIGGGRTSELLCFLRQLKFAELPDHLDIYSNSSRVICGFLLCLMGMPNILMCA